MLGDQGRGVVVIGASRGIGTAIAEAFTTAGDRVFATHRGSGVPVEKVRPVTMDISDQSSVDSGFTEIEQHTAPEVVVCNAGINRDGLLIRMSDEDYRDVVEVNQIGVFRVVRRAVQSMIKARRGSIVLVSSASARAGQAGQTNYAATKAALEGFARSTAREYATRGIRCNVVLPGPVDTDMVSALPAKQRDALRAQVPLGRLGRPEEIADAVLWVANAEFVTGATIPVTGGAAMGC